MIARAFEAHGCVGLVLTTVFALGVGVGMGIVLWLVTQRDSR